MFQSLNTYTHTNTTSSGQRQAVPQDIQTTTQTQSARQIFEQEYFSKVCGKTGLLPCSIRYAEFIQYIAKFHLKFF